MKDELELSAGGIPASLKAFFQEYDFNKLDAKQHQDLVIERTLNYGDRREARWLYERYGRNAIADWVREYGSRLLSRRRFSYWRTILDVADFKRSAHWDNRIWPH